LTINSQDTLVTKASAVVFAFEKGGSSWVPIAGTNEVSHVCIYKNSKDNYKLVVTLEKNGKVSRWNNDYTLRIEDP